jgi:replicative DNA helicase
VSATDYSLDRGLPASPEAERSILGAILLDNSLANEALIALKADHFFLDAHRRIYQRLTEMMEQGTPLDIVSLTVDLMAHKELEAVGGAGYLASLTDGVPRRTSVQHYVSIVIEKANARNFIHSCNAGIALALEQQVNVLDMIEQHNQSIANISAETGGARDIAVPAREFLDKIKADREWLVDGLIEKGSNGFVVAEPKGSKAQPLDAKILTPSGWRLMGSLQVGDDVFGADGTPTRVVGIFPHGIKKCYRVNISDGTSTECTDEHLWTIQSHNAIERGQGYQTMRTEEIANLLTQHISPRVRSDSVSRETIDSTRVHVWSNPWRWWIDR